MNNQNQTQNQNQINKNKNPNQTNKQKPKTKTFPKNLILLRGSHKSTKFWKENNINGKTIKTKEKQAGKQTKKLNKGCVYLESHDAEITNIQKCTLI